MFRKSHIIQAVNFAVKMGVRPFYIIISALLEFFTALFDGIAIALLIPLAKGVIGMDFSFAHSLPVFRTIVSANPKFFLFTYPNASIFVLLLSTIFAATVVKNGFSYFSSLIMVYQARQYCRNVRGIIFSRYLDFGKLFFDRTSSGRLYTILIGFSERVAELIIHLRTLISDIFKLIVYVGIMFAISWKLAIFTRALFPIFHYSLNWLTEKIKAASKHYAESRINQARRVFDMLTCLPLIKSYAREKEELKRFSGLADGVAKSRFAIDKKRLLVYPIQEMVLVIVFLLILSVMAFIFIREQAVSISAFLVFFYALRRCAPLFNSLNHFKMQVVTHEGPMKAISQILSDKDKFIIAEGKIEFKGLKEKIEFNGLNFSYAKEVQVIKNISFSIPKNTMTAIVGPTGSGKTTLINLILRFYNAPPGSIFIDDIDIRDFTLKSLRRQMALVSQDTLLFNDTLRHNMTYGVEKRLSDRELIEVTKKAELHDFIMKLPDKFDTLIGDRGVKLSGGEKQRLSIARALLKGAEILIMDEATSSLDTRTERLIQKAINEAVKNKTAIVIAHRLSTIKHADKIVVIENGKLVEEGTLDGLLDKKGKFYQYWQEQKFD